MEKIIRKKGILMSILMGMTMGLTFSTIAKLRMGAPILPLDILITIVTSAITGIFIGLVIPVRKLQEGSVKLLKIPESKQLLCNIVMSLTSSLIFTPINCIPNMWYGMAMGMQNLPPDVVTVPQRLMFVAGLPHFAPALISTLLINILIGTVLGSIVSPLYNKLTNRMLGI